MKPFREPLIQNKSRQVYVAFNPTLLPTEQASPNFTALLELLGGGKTSLPGEP